MSGFLLQSLTQLQIVKNTFFVKENQKTHFHLHKFLYLIPLPNQLANAKKNYFILSAFNCISIGCTTTTKTKCG
jgi:hypothetical protein